MGCGSGKLIPSGSDRVHICEHLVEVPLDGTVEYGWTLTSGDPLGAYEIRYYVDGIFIEKFNFAVK
jgi:hypothetical protein